MCTYSGDTRVTRDTIRVFNRVTRNAHGNPPRCSMSVGFGPRKYPCRKNGKRRKSPALHAATTPRRLGLLRAYLTPLTPRPDRIVLDTISKSGAIEAKQNTMIKTSHERATIAFMSYTVYLHEIAQSSAKIDRPLCFTRHHAWKRDDPASSGKKTIRNNRRIGWNQVATARPLRINIERFQNITTASRPCCRRGTPARRTAHCPVRCLSPIELCAPASSSRQCSKWKNNTMWTMRFLKK